MKSQFEAPNLKSLRREFALVISQAEYYENGHADLGIENAIAASAIDAKPDSA